MYVPVVDVDIVEKILSAEVVIVNLSLIKSLLGHLHFSHLIMHIYYNPPRRSVDHSNSPVPVADIPRLVLLLQGYTTLPAAQCLVLLAAYQLVADIVELAHLADLQNNIYR